MISVVIPAYNEESTIAQAASVIAGILEGEKIAYELLFVDDGSADLTWKKIGEAHAANPNVRGISFSRNFGKEAAIFAGLAEAKGDCAVVIDCDLQHPPVKIAEMYRLWEQGYEIVEGVKKSRGNETGAHSFMAKLFYQLISKTSGIDMENASDFKLLDRKAVDALISIPEKRAFFRALSSWVGYRSTKVEYDVQERVAGTTKWSTKALVQYAISNITAFTTLPMQIVTILGVIMFVMGTFLGVQALVKWAMGTALGGFTTVIILQCFSSSIIMVSLGIIGYYISKIYEGVQNRPRFLISRTTEDAEK